MEIAIDGCPRPRDSRRALRRARFRGVHARRHVDPAPGRPRSSRRVSDEALELAAPDTRARAMALVTSTYADIGDGAARGSEAYSIAERLGDPMLKSVALDAQQRVAMDRGEYEAAWQLNSRRLALLDALTDADLRADVVQSPIPACIATCRFDEARELARRTDEVTRPLTPHHRVHGVSALVEVEELLGGWARSRRSRTASATRSPPTRRRRAAATPGRCSSARWPTLTWARSQRARELEENAGAARPGGPPHARRAAAPAGAAASASERGPRSCSP